MNEEDQYKVTENRPPPFAIDYGKLERTLSRGQLLDKDINVPVVVDVDGQSRIIGMATLTGNGGSISLFSNPPKEFVKMFKLGLLEIQLHPIEPLVLRPTEEGV